LKAGAATRLKHFELSEKVIGCFYDVYNELGPGFLESVYREAMLVALLQIEVPAQREVPIPVFFRGVNVGDFRADLVVDGVLVLELKTSKCLESSHEAQLHHYLRDEHRGRLAPQFRSKTRVQKGCI
jgi:GxxExxY protein